MTFPHFDSVLSEKLIVFFFNDTATTEIYTLSLHDALPISGGIRGAGRGLGPFQRFDSDARVGDALVGTALVRAAQLVARLDLLVHLREKPFGEPVEL